jgi:hypothetical protein
MEWRELQQTWQERPDKPMPDLESMIHSRTQWIWFLTALDCLATLMIAVFLYRALSDDPGPSEWVFSAAIVAFTVLGWWAVLRIRSGTWRVDSQAPAAMLALLIRRCRASILLARMNFWAVFVGVAVALVFRFGLRPHMDVPDIELSDPMRSGLRIVVLIVAVGWAVGAHLYRRRKTAELNRLLAMSREFGEGED